MRDFLRELLIIVVTGALIFLGLQLTVQSFIVIGSSMEPSFQDGQRLLVSKTAYKFHEPERGDVIVFHLPNGQKVDYIKRIIALPGETVEIKKGTVYIYQNDEALPLDEDSYIDDPPDYTFQRYKVPGNSYFVLGDNRNNSNDSHNDWVVPREKIIGKAWLLVWPPNDWGLAANYPLEEQIASAHE
jgi:signal peptidase I